MTDNPAYRELLDALKVARIALALAIQRIERGEPGAALTGLRWAEDATAASIEAHRESDIP